MGVEGSSHPLFTFFDEDLPPEGATHTRPLQITIECMGAKVPMVFIDNGSALNVCPFKIAFTIGLDMVTIIPSPLTVRAYDNTSRKVMGTFKAPCKIGPIETIVEFHVMEITPNYSLFLGRAWLYPNGAIPFSLYQKMKISWKGGIAIVLGNGEILAPICGLEEGGSELQMSGFKFVNMADYGLKDERYTIDLFPYCSHEVIAMMKNMGYMPGISLGKEGKRVVEFSNIKTQVIREGLEFLKAKKESRKTLALSMGTS